MPEPGLEPRAAAHREAGHAVAALLQDLVVVSASIDRSDHSSGVREAPWVCENSAPTPVERRIMGRALIVACFAGGVAEAISAHSQVAHDGQADRNHALEIAGVFGVVPRNCGPIGSARHLEYLEQLHDEARELVHRHRTVIQAMAEALLVEKTLDRNRVIEIFENW